MLESYGALILIGGCILLVIWIHGQQARRPSQSVSGGRESLAPVKSLYAQRAGDEPDYVELEKMSRESGFQTYRIEDLDLPRDSLEFGRPRQMEILLHQPGETLLLILQVEFSEPCSGEALYELLSRVGLRLAEDGLYRKTQGDGGSAPIYYVANHSRTGSFSRQGTLIDTLPGITFFTQLPLEANGLHVFNGMLRVAEEVRDGFGGTLLNEEGESLTEELVKAVVQRVDAFESSRLNSGRTLMH